MFLLLFIWSECDTTHLSLFALFLLFVNHCISNYGEHLEFDCPLQTMSQLLVDL